MNPVGLQKTLRLGKQTWGVWLLVGVATVAFATGFFGEAISHSKKPFDTFYFSRPPSIYFFGAIWLRNVYVAAITCCVSLAVFPFPAIKMALWARHLGSLCYAEGWAIFCERAFPHGIVEIPTVLWISGAAMVGGFNVFIAPWRNKLAVLVEEGRKLLKLLAIGSVVLFAAAVLEVYGNGIWRFVR